MSIYDTNSQSLLLTQIASPEGASSAVTEVNAATDYGYTKGMTVYTKNSTDNLFSDGVSTELANISGSIDEGFTLKHSILASS